MSVSAFCRSRRKRLCRSVRKRSAGRDEIVAFPALVPFNDAVYRLGITDLEAVEGFPLFLEMTVIFRFEVFVLPSR